MLQSMESQLQRERQRRMEEEMRGKKEQERREEAEREKVMGLDINQDGEFCRDDGDGGWWARARRKKNAKN